jgi:uncharacterized protein YprB with RNaseH-like and TPR domain
MELRERLRALSKGESRQRIERVPLPYLQPIENEHGETYYCDKIYIERHGQIDLTNFPDFECENVRFLTLDRRLSSLSLREIVFLDIETTGTAGGTGTYAFLVGLGFAEEGYFQIRQFFLHDLAHEGAFLHAITEFCRRFKHLVTYNGKCFDAQVLRNRYLMHRWEDPFSEKQHIDMLFVARRLWKRRFHECNLTNLERQVLNFYRVDDIPGFLIPSAYTDYLRFANASMIQQVIHHNQWDIVSLAVLMARACLLLSQKEELSAEEHLSLSFLYERQKDFHTAIEHLLQALCGSHRRTVLLALARNLRRVRDRSQMRWLVKQAEEETLDDQLCRQLCIVCEHDLKDFDLALSFADAQIQKLEKYRGLSNNYRMLLEDWSHRRKRLLRKTSAQGHFTVPILSD